VQEATSIVEQIPRASDRMMGRDMCANQVAFLNITLGRGKPLRYARTHLRRSFGERAGNLRELLIDREEDRTLRAVLVGMLREDHRGR
jgi:hypothetical protein